MWSSSSSLVSLSCIYSGMTLHSQSQWVSLCASFSSFFRITFCGFLCHTLLWYLQMTLGLLIIIDCPLYSSLMPVLYIRISHKHTHKLCSSNVRSYQILYKSHLSISSYETQKFSCKLTNYSNKLINILRDELIDTFSENHTNNCNKQITVCVTGTKLNLFTPNGTPQMVTRPISTTAHQLIVFNWLKWCVRESILKSSELGTHSMILISKYEMIV